LRDQSGAAVDSISIGWSDVGSCASLVEITGTFSGAPETRVIENALSGLTVQDLPSRSLYRVRVKRICNQAESDWSEPIDLCTSIPAPTGLSVEMLPAGGAANVVWNLQFGRQVLNLETLGVRIVRSRGGAPTVVHETAADGVLSGRFQDSTFGPGDSYKAFVFGVDLADSTQTMVSEASAEVLPLLTVSSLPKRPMLETMPLPGTFGFPRWNGM
jgi:hypothetical protein